MREFFNDWLTKTVDFKTRVETVDSYGRPIVTESTVYSGVQIQIWVDSVNESNINDKFVGNKIGTAIIPVSLAVNDSMHFEIDGVKHYVTGPDDIAYLGDLKIITWRQEYE